MRTLLRNLIVAFLLIISFNLNAQNNVDVNKVYQVKDLLDDKILNVEIK